MPHLVVTRRPGERIVITVPPSEAEQTISVEVLERQSDNIRIGVSAAKEVLILRGELVGRREDSKQP